MKKLLARLGQLDRSAVVAAVVVAYVFGAGVTWAALTPVGGAPDEPGHIAYAAAVVRGDIGELVAGSEKTRQRLIVVTAPEWVNSFTSPPRSVADFNYPCFADNVSATADCAPNLTGSKTLAEVPTTVGRYPPLFHAVVGVPTLVLSGNRAVYAMRIVAAGLAAGMLALGLTVAAPSRRTWLGLGAAIAFTPTAAHLAGSVNPSGLEISAALGLGIGLMGITGSQAPRKWTVAAAVVLSFAVAWSRPLGYLTLAAVIAASALINGNNLRAWLGGTGSRLAPVIGVGAAFVSAVIYLLAWGLPIRAASAEGPATGSTLFTSPGLDGGLDDVENHLIGWTLDLIGRFGWADHSPPVSVLFGWTLLVLALALFVILGANRRQRIALTVIGVGALILTPLLAITRFINTSAYQARYHLPVAVLVIIGLAATAAGMEQSDERRLSLQLLRWGAALAPLAMLVSNIGSLHRYSFGFEAQLVDLGNLLGEHTQWLPPREALIAAGFGSAIVFAAAALAVAFALNPSEHGDPEAPVSRDGTS